VLKYFRCYIKIGPKIEMMAPKKKLSGSAVPPFRGCRADKQKNIIVEFTPTKARYYNKKMFKL